MQRAIHCPPYHLRWQGPTLRIICLGNSPPSYRKMHLAGLNAGSLSEDRPLGWDPVAAGNRAGDGMARFVSEEKASGVPYPNSFSATLRATSMTLSIS